MLLIFAEKAKHLPQRHSKVITITPIQTHCLTCLIRPLSRKQSELWRQTVPTLSVPMTPQSCLAFPSPPPLHSHLLSSPSCFWPLKGEREREREIHRSMAIAERPPRPLPPALPCIVSMSSRNPVAMALKMALQPLCLMISWMIAYLSEIHALFCWNARQRGTSFSL